VVGEWHDDQRVTIVEYSTIDGTSHELSQFVDACYVGRCDVNNIQLATNLLPGMGIRPADPDRGPDVVRVHWQVAGVSIAAALAVIVPIAVWVDWYSRRGKRTGTQQAQAA